MTPSSTVVRYNSPCAACKFLRRKCMPDCVFAPYFPPEEPLKFSHVHKIFGASNVTKLLNEVLPYQREDTVSSLAYEAEARVRDPVYGCVGVISFLQLQVERLQKELDAANAELIHYACGCNQYCYYQHQNFSTSAFPATSSLPIYPSYAQVPPQMRPVGGISYYQTPSTFSFPWNDKNVSGQGGAAGRGL
ncbi:Protein LATERAL ORGAN BOUNDARIES [Heracleum sosnowskyi]|uniref:Protein LATERAL ORGAN BOUNDARIES n=1 Tax=Heracleum sosnowskyi TaxID=360622 RepID=A0AAD8GZY5_9APIA|nr:Protein LATERAL ORGAN BOUNDARIES [Heracleum sosnowskyi]